MRTIKKIILFSIITILLKNCGYKALSNLETNNYNFTNISLEGDRRVGQIIKQELMVNSNKESKNNFNIILKVNKQKKIKDKDIKGVIKDYSITITVELTFKDKEKIISKTIRRSLDYETTGIHSTTLVRERKITQRVATAVSKGIERYFEIYLR